MPLPAHDCNPCNCMRCKRNQRFPLRVSAVSAYTGANERLARGP